MKKNPRIVVVGSLNMDLVVTANRMPLMGETIQGEAIHYVSGGKGANQAVGCARLGADVTLIGAVGNDGFGHQLVSEMEQNGVTAERIPRLKGVPTGTATIMHTPEDNCIIIVPGANGQVAPELVEASRDAIQSADLLLVQLEIPIASVMTALRIARDSGVVTVLNPAPAKPLPDDLLELADWITPNETEFAALCGLDGLSGSMEEERLGMEMKRWQERYGTRVIVTLGKRGACYLDGGLLVMISAPSAVVVDTTGAGDCLNAAFGFAIAGGMNPREALAFAVRAATLSVTRFGAQAGMPTLKEVEARVE